MAVAGKFNIQVGRLKQSQIAERERAGRQGGDAMSQSRDPQGEETQDDTPAHTPPGAAQQRSRSIL